MTRKQFKALVEEAIDTIPARFAREVHNVAIVIEDDRIAAIGPAPAVAQQYRGASFDRVVDGRRRLAMPGLVDAHLHLCEELSGSLFPDNLSTRPWVFNWPSRTTRP